MAAKRGANTFDYPVGIGTAGKGISGQPYMLLTSYESKNAIESKGSKIISSIALYIPPNALTTAFAASYGGAEGAAMRATLGGAVSSLNMGALKAVGTLGFGGDWDQGNIAESLFAGFGSAGTAAEGKIAGAVDKGTGMLAAQGIAVNNHMSLVYKGPSQFRTHDFSFNFFPKAKQDAEAIRRIIEDLRDGMLPRMYQKGEIGATKGRSVSSPFFMAPRHWTIDFFKGDGKPNMYVHKMKKSVIKNMQRNHDPNRTISFHEDGSPVQTTLTLTFQEIELPISGDDAKERSEQISKDIEISQQTTTKPGT